MEDINVNNLNGIPNFGHGFPEEHEAINEENAHADEEVSEEDAAGDGSEEEESEDVEHSE